MKNKRCMIALMAALIILMAQPVCSFAALSDGASLVDTDVSCTVEPVFEFSLPPDATIRYPNTSVLAGQFGIGDLLLRNGEQLSVELTTGRMAARTNAGDVLPYAVTFNPPAAVDENQIGQSYGVAVTIDADAFDDARRSVYDAALLFRVRSLLTGEVIWQGHDNGYGAQSAAR